ncbi:hypothetical protein C8J57DRAFT_1521950 [Mycena rebaudengoi]|nr:hypothetical protein C8J57DRAFT_1521950 [Mycena rebaudengoi]
MRSGFPKIVLFRVLRAEIKSQGRAFTASCLSPEYVWIFLKQSLVVGVVPVVFATAHSAELQQNSIDPDTKWFGAEVWRSVGKFAVNIAKGIVSSSLCGGRSLFLGFRFSRCTWAVDKMSTLVDEESSIAGNL